MNGVHSFLTQRKVATGGGGGGTLADYYELEDSLFVAHRWKLDAFSGGIYPLDDIGDWHLTSLPNSGSAWTGGTRDDSGPLGAGACHFNGSDGRLVAFPSLASHAFTFNVWVRLGSGETGMPFSATRVSEWIGLWLQATPTYEGFTANNGGVSAESAIYSGIGNSDNWCMMTIVSASATSRKLYMNGVLTNYTTDTVATFYPNEINLGVLGGNWRINGFGSFYSGKLALPSFYNYEVSASDLLSLHDLV